MFAVMMIVIFTLVIFIIYFIFVMLVIMIFVITTITFVNEKCYDKYITKTSKNTHKALQGPHWGRILYHVHTSVLHQLIHSVLTERRHVIVDVQLCASKEWRTYHYGRQGMGSHEQAVTQ